MNVLVFFSNAEINCEEYIIDIFVFFYHYKNISPFSLHKQLFPEHGKTCTSCMDLENTEELNVKTRKSVVLK